MVFRKSYRHRIPTPSATASRSSRYVRLRRGWCTSFTLLIVLVFCGPLHGQVILKAGVFAGGGGELSGGPFLMNATAGQVFGDVAYTLTTVHGAGFWYIQHGQAVLVSTEDTGPGGEGIPDRFELDQNYPNPFNPSTTIRYGVPEPSRVRIVVYNMLGRIVKVLVDEERAAGYFSVTWDGRSGAGAPASSGLYVYVMEGKDFRSTRKMVLVK